MQLSIDPDTTEIHCVPLIMSVKRVNTTATARLKQDYIRIVKDPVPYVSAMPLPSNILEW